MPGHCLTHEHWARQIQRALAGNGIQNVSQDVARCAHRLLHATLRLGHLYLGLDIRKHAPVLLHLGLVAHIVLVLASTGEYAQ
jgi:hypothetical protein